MKLRTEWILVMTLMMIVFCACISNTSSDTTLLPASNVALNGQADENINNDKGKLLDTALKISGKKLSTDERSAVSRMLNLNENDVIKGLSVFLELSGGRYPSKLDARTTLTEAEALWRAKYNGISIDRTEDKGEKKEGKEKIYDIFFASAYYEKLIREKRDVAYYGDRITVEDSDKMLMRWKIYNGRYKVIFGDLTAENVSTERLAELEKRSVK